MKTIYSKVDARIVYEQNNTIVEMILMATQFIMEGRQLFRKMVDFTPVTTAALTATWINIPVYNTIWVEFVITAGGGKSGTVTITPNTTGGNITPTAVTIATGTTERIWVLVNGQYSTPTGNLALGSTMLKVEHVDGDGHSNLSGYYVIHGSRIV